MRRTMRAMAIPEIATERLRLRGWRDGDRDAVRGDERRPGGDGALPGALDRGGERRARRADATAGREHGFGLWAVERRADGAFLGFAGLSRPWFEAHFTPAVEVGWRLARDAWGHGYATEAARGGARVRLRDARPRGDRLVHRAGERAVAARSWSGSG